MEHLNESFAGVEESLIAAIRLLGVHAMGIDPEGTRREALDQLAIALECLKTGEAEIREEYITPSFSEGKAENKPDAPSKGEPFRVFQTEKELVAFLAKMTNEVNGIAHEEAIRKSKEDMRSFTEKQALKRSLLAPGEIYCDTNFLEEARESICEILERLPDLGGNELTTEINEAAIRVWSRLSMVLRWGAKDHEEEDIDTSDNDAANDAQEGAAQ